MVRTAVADENFLNYMTDLANLGTCVVGLILGQPTSAKDYIIHFTKTPLSEEKSSEEPFAIKKFSEVSDSWMADHAKHVTRMLPGGMYVLGIFVVSEEDIISTFSIKIKTVLTQIHRRLGSNEFLYGNPSIPERLVLNYSIGSHTYSCKSYDIETGMVKPADLKFQPNLSVKWLQVECRYELDQLFPILLEKANWPLKKHMQDILLYINKNLKSATFFFDGEVKEGSDNLEIIGKKRKAPRTRSGHADSGDAKPMLVTIVLHCDGQNTNQSLEITECGGQIRLAGHVASKLWLHPKATVNEASQTVIEDICRSLAARLEMHWDSLIEGEHGTYDDVNSIHEPPRRVFVNLPSCKVHFSDYLFPGEGPQEAQISLQELLDIQFLDANSISDIEGQADLSEVCSDNKLDADSEEMLNKLPNKFIYLTGLAIAFLVFVLSLIIHFVQNL